MLREILRSNAAVGAWILWAVAAGGPIAAQAPAEPEQGVAGDAVQQPETPQAGEEAAPEAGGEPGQASFFEVTTVTATGSAIDTFEVANPVTVIASEQIERMAVDNPSDLLREQPGVDVNGVGPNQSRPIIRGQRGLRVLFLENGLRMNNARRQTDFGEIPGLVDLEAVASMEVVRGPASVLYGSDAIGGVLNLITKVPSAHATRAVGGSLALRYGSAAEQTVGSATVDGRFRRFSFRLGGTYRDGEDYQAAAGSFGDVRLGEEVAVVDTGLTDRAVNTYLGFQPSSRHQLFLRSNIYRADQTGFGFVEPELLGQAEPFRIRILYPFQDFERFTLGYSGGNFDLPVADSAEVQAYFQSNERQLVNDIDIDIGPLFPGAPNSSVAADTLNFTDLDTLGLRAELFKVVSDRHLITYGVEAFRDESFNTDSSVTTTTLRFPFPPFEVIDVASDDVPNAPNATNTSYGIFAQDEITVGDRLKLTVGARLQNISTQAEPTPGWDIRGLDFDDRNLVGGINAVYALNEHLNLVGSYGTAFRAPNIIERLFNGLTPEGVGFQVLNPDLVSEESDNIDLGLKYRRRNVTFELIVFRNDIDNGIVQFNLSEEDIAQLPPETQEQIEALGIDFVVQQRNVERLRNEGVELTLGYRFRSFEVGGNYTHLDASRSDSDNPPTGDAISDKLNVHLRYLPRQGRYWLEYRLRYNGDEPTVINPGDPVPAIGESIPSFTLHSVGGGVTLARRGGQEHVLNLVIDNLTDRLYTEFSNATFFRPQPKRNVSLTYRLRF